MAWFIRLMIWGTDLLAQTTVREEILYFYQVDSWRGGQIENRDECEVMITWTAFYGAEGFVVHNKLQIGR